MPVYKLSASGNAELKKSWIVTMVAAYIAIIAAFYYSMVYKSGDKQHLWIFAVVVVVLLTTMFLGRKKYFKGVDESELIIGEESLTLRALNLPDKVVTYKAIREVKPHKRGLELLGKDKSARLLIIIKQFEDIDAIENAITKKIGQPATIR